MVSVGSSRRLIVAAPAATMRRDHARPSGRDTHGVGIDPRGELQMLTPPRTAVAMLAAALVTTIGAAPAPAANKSAARTTVQIALTSTSQAAPFYLGIKKGFYARQGIDLKINKDITIQATLASVASGAVDGSGLTVGGFVAGVAGGLPLVAINTTSTGGLTPETDDPQLVTRADSGITKVADLRGKTIAVGGFGGALEVSARRAAQRAGIGATSIKLISVPFPQMGALLRTKQIDAALMAEPFTTQLKRELDIRVLAGGTLVWRKGQQFYCLMMSRKWWDANPALGRRLQLATRQSVDYAGRNPREVRALLPSLTGVPASVTNRQTLPRYVSKMDLKDIQNTARVMKAYNAVKVLPDMSKFVIQPPAKKAPRKK